MSDAELAERLASITLELVGTPSVSGQEADVLSRIRARMPSPGFFELTEDRDTVLFYVPELRRPETPFVVLAGHVDTVPGAGTPVRLHEGAIVGRGAADMKGALAVMVESARALAGGDVASDLDIGFLFFGREELPISESALLPFFQRNALARTIDLAIVMEPTDNDLEVGCLGNLNARVIVHGATAHSARPWLGENAIHAAIRALAPLADLPTREVEIDGLVFREVVSVTKIAGGDALNVVPDRVEAHVNMRYAPTHTPAEAEARLRELLGAHRVELDIVGNAPPGPVNVTHPLVTRLRRAGDLRVGAKQAWTPVAEFAAVGVDAVNLGPGHPQYAHKDDERVEVASLVRSDELLRAFLTGAAGG